MVDLERAEVIDILEYRDSVQDKNNLLKNI